MEDIIEQGKVKDLGRWGLYTIKTQLALFDMRQSIFWQSLIQIGILVSSLFLLLIRGKFMVFLHLFHAIRPYLAYIIIRDLPRTHQIYELIPDDLMAGMPIASQRLFSDFKYAYKIMSLYMIATVVCGGFDILGLFIDILGLGGTDNSSVYYTVVAWVFLSFDLYFFLWFLTLKPSFPQEIWVNLGKLAQGGLEEAKMIIRGVLNRNS